MCNIMDGNLKKLERQIETGNERILGCQMMFKTNIYKEGANI